MQDATFLNVNPYVLVVFFVQFPTVFSPSLILLPGSDNNIPITPVRFWTIQWAASLLWCYHLTRDLFWLAHAHCL